MCCIPNLRMPGNPWKCQLAQAAHLKFQSCKLETGPAQTNLASYPKPARSSDSVNKVER